MSTELVSALAIVAAAIVSVLTAKLTNKASPYASLAERVIALEKADDAKSKRIDELEEKRKVDKRRIDDLTQNVTDLQEDRDVLVEVVAGQIEWQDSGAEPPPPAITDRARALVARLRKHHGDRATTGGE